MPLIVIVEDEPDIIELVRFTLQKEKFEVTALTTGEGAQKKIETIQPDLVILDLMLPGKSGYDICKGLKSNPKTEGIPIIILSAKSEEIDIVMGLEFGADDYLNKPFSPRVLLARIRALLRRQKPTGPTAAPLVFETYQLEIDPNSQQVKIDNTPITLTTSEFKTLFFLAEKPGWVFSRYQIVEAVRGEHYIVTDRSIDVLIVGLRKKLGNLEHIIETVRGAGYRFKTP